LLGYAAGARWARAFLWIGAFLTLAGNVAAVFLPGFSELFMSRSAAGIGEGMLIGSLNATVARLDEPERRYGLINAVMNIAAFVLILLIPAGLAYLRVPRGVFAILAMATVLCMPLLLLFPAEVQSEDVDRQPGVGGWRGLLVCAAILLLSTAAGSVYPVSLVIGQNAGIAEQSIDAALSLAIVGAIFGSYAAAWSTRVFGVLGSTLVVAAGLVLAPALLTHSRALPEFALGMFTLGLFWYLGFTQCLGLAAQVDPTGGCAAAGAGAFFLGGGIGPLLGGYEVQWSGGRYSVFVSSVLALVSLCVLCIWTTGAWLKRGSA
jgi:MFS transporter, DHA1 family, inner membrane transport protein